MAVSTVKLEGDAFMVCLIHALSTEREEVMGLLIGEVDNGVTHIYSVIMLQRLDKRKDRVEISPEQLSDASDQAEILGKLTKGKKPMRVVGWYHSHPHITVWPSHVDLRTQAMYQVMDQGFIGLIFSCFNDDPRSSGQVKVICFQSIDVNPNNGLPQYQKEEIELQIIPTATISQANLDRLTELPQILAKEEESAYEKVMRSADLITLIHNGTVFTKAVCQLTEVICGPLLQVLENRLELNKRRAIELEEEKKRLLKELKEISTENII